uniref:Uncharacterized protein n=1 Tax=Candidatus Kentrum sp. SD TaxID=2126332 RepID=A0A451BQR1_9GAMM|nr:MAG: hypothetical protein BECKSD772D_GA0070982_113312 [Candidatus Kentron sp. SD]
MSGETAAELRNGDYPKKQEVLAFVSEIPILSLETAIIDTAETYLKHYLMPQKLEGDALHLAYASYYKMGFLLTCLKLKLPAITWPTPTSNSTSGSSIPG